MLAHESAGLVQVGLCDVTLTVAGVRDEAYEVRILDIAHNAHYVSECWTGNIGIRLTS